jgi:hypothetical protein
LRLMTGESALFISSISWQIILNSSMVVDQANQEVSSSMLLAQLSLENCISCEEFYC